MTAKRSTFSPELPTTAIFEIPLPKTDAPQQDKREMYTFFAGHQRCELGHLIAGAKLQQHKGGTHTPGFAFSMLHPDLSWVNIYVKPSEQVRKAWDALSGYGIHSMLIKKRPDGLYSVVVSGPSPCSGYVAGLISQEDVDYLVEQTTSPEPISA